MLRRARNGDGQAWVRLVDVYGPIVYRWSRIKGLQPADARDVMQDVFRNVARALPSFRKERPSDTFRGWLFVITRNELAQHFRRNAKNADVVGGSAAHQKLQQLRDDEATWTESLSVTDEHRIVQRALGLLRSEVEESTWTAFWRMTVDGHSAAEIGADLGMTNKAVRQAKYRVLLKLRELLSDDLDGSPE